MNEEYAMTDDEWIIYDELISDGFSHEYAINYIDVLNNELSNK